MLLLRDKIATARGFGDSIQIPILAKMMLAEYFFVDEYKKIAALTDDNGKCSLLRTYELQVTEPFKEETPLDEGAEISKAEAKNTFISIKPERNKDLESWENNADFTAWVSIEPHLGEIDLRPYFFASKEKEDFFFFVHPEQLRSARQLMSNEARICCEMMILRHYPHPDAKIVFRDSMCKNLPEWRYR